jgi:hypothetical protein
MIIILRTHKLNTTEFILFFETKCINSTFADRFFKSVFKSWRFEKHASKSYSIIEIGQDNIFKN